MRTRSCCSQKNDKILTIIICEDRKIEEKLTKSLIAESRSFPSNMSLMLSARFLLQHLRSNFFSFIFSINSEIFFSLCASKQDLRERELKVVKIETRKFGLTYLTFSLSTRACPTCSPKHAHLQQTSEESVVHHIMTQSSGCTGHLSPISSASLFWTR